MSAYEKIEARLDTFTMERPVLDADKLVAIAHRIGETVFGSESAGIAGLYDEEVSARNGEAYNLVQSVGLPRLRVIYPEDLKLRQFGLWSPKELNYDGAFTYASNRLTKHVKKTTGAIVGDGDSPAKSRASGLYATLTSIGLDYGYPDQTDVPIRAWSLINPIIPPASIGPDSRRYLSLSLNPLDLATIMLNAQVAAVMQRFTDTPNLSKKLVYPSTDLLPHIPFCSLPHDITREEGDRFISLIDKHIKESDLRLGGVHIDVARQDYR